MPVLNALATSAWLPDNEQLRQAEYRMDARHHLMFNLLGELPEFAAASVNEVDEYLAVKPEQVIVVPHVFHAWGKNLPSVWLDFQPDEVGSDARAREIRRWHIMANLKDRVTKWLKSNNAVNAPELDVECRPLSGSGMTVDSFGHSLQDWGKPEYLR